MDSYCLDIRVGRDEQYREELIEFLKKTGAPFELGKASRGMWDGVKILRVETPKAEELTQHIINGLRTGDDNDYEVHESRTDANRSMTWLPDLDTEFGYKAFDLVPEAAIAEASEQAGQGSEADFPKFGVTIDGGLKFMSKGEIRAVYKSDSPIEITSSVLDANSSLVRDVTREELDELMADL